jgi:hypothetical protein
MISFSSLVENGERVDTQAGMVPVARGEAAIHSNYRVRYQH